MGSGGKIGEKEEKQMNWVGLSRDPSVLRNENYNSSVGREEPSGGFGVLHQLSNPPSSPPRDKERR